LAVRGLTPKGSDPGLSVSNCRERFPIFEQRVYINSCSQGALSDAVRASYEQYLADWDEYGAPWEYWVERQEAARAAFAGLVNAEPDEVAVTTSLSAGVSALASGLRFTRRSKVVLTDWEFPTIGQIWHAQEARGARVVHGSTVEELDRLIDDDTLLVSITHVSYRTGAMTDVPRLVELAHERGALVLLDAFQSIGSLPVDVKDLGVDFLGAGVLKYLLGSAGLGFFYCRRDLVERVWPTQTGWFADENIFAMDHTDYSPAHTAARFQSGTPPVPAIYAGIAGIELMQEIGIAATRAHVNELNEHFGAGVEELGAKFVTPRDLHGALMCVKSTDARALVAALDAEGIVTSDRDGNVRVSAHCYNTVEDVDAVLAALQKHRKLLA
jgi:selenocysteine lyase/cysteine desulfurase